MVEEYGAVLERRLVVQVRVCVLTGCDASETSEQLVVGSAWYCY
jgi:hypothetical protein